MADDEIPLLEDEDGAPLPELIQRAHREAIRQARVDVLDRLAYRWQISAWSDVLLPKPQPPAVPVIAYANRVGDWLRAQAAAAEEGDR